MLRNTLEAKAKLAHLPDGYPTDKRGFFSSFEQCLGKTGWGNGSPQYLLCRNGVFCLAPGSVCLSGEVLLPYTTPAVLLVVDNFADANPYLPFHPEHPVFVSNRIQGGMSYGCAWWLCPSPWTEQHGCLLKPLVWEGSTSQTYPFCWG